VLYYRNNVTETLELAAAAAGSGVRAMILSSTAAVYGDGDGTPLSETSPITPINPYGASKAMAERLLADIGRATGMGVGVLRYFNVAGADPHGRSGQNSAHPHHLIEVATRVVMGDRPKIQVFGTDYPTPDGTAVRDYVHVSDIADAHIAVMDALLADGPGAHRLYNLGYGRGASVREVLEAMAGVAGDSVPAENAPRRAGDPALLVADSAKIRDELDWRPRHNRMDEILEHALAWEKRRRRLVGAGADRR
jgi:UDP-glucose 4-epimerase